MVEPCIVEKVRFIVDNDSDEIEVIDRVFDVRALPRRVEAAT
jgi:hypothetical protein